LQTVQNPLWNLKTTVPETVPGVRIPLPPPATLIVTSGPKAFEIVQLNPTQQSQDKFRRRAKR